MATDQAGESRDVGTLLHWERQVLEMIATGVPPMAVLDARCSVIDQRSSLVSPMFFVDGDGKRLTEVAAPHLSNDWRRATSFLRLPLATISRGAAVFRREQVTGRHLRSAV